MSRHNGHASGAEMVRNNSSRHGDGRVVQRREHLIENPKRRGRRKQSREANAPPLSSRKQSRRQIPVIFQSQLSEFFFRLFTPQRSSRKSTRHTQILNRR